MQRSSAQPARRRVVTAAIALVGVAGCASRANEGARRTAASTAPASSASIVTLPTRLGQIHLRQAAATPPWRSIIASAADRVAAVWGRAAEPLDVRVLTSDAEFAAVADDLDGDTAAVTTPGGVIIGPAVGRTLDTAGQRVVVAHELTHARLGQYGADRTPLWVREGLAEWTALHGVSLAQAKLWPALAKDVRAGGGPDGPPSDVTFGRDRSLAYEISAAWCTYLGATAGADAVRALAGERGTAEAATRHAMALLPDNAPTFRAWLREAMG